MCVVCECLCVCVCVCVCVCECGVCVCVCFCGSLMMVPEAAETYWLILIYEKHILSMCACLFVCLFVCLLGEFNSFCNARISCI